MPVSIRRGTNRNAGARAHARDLPIYDELPLELRDRLKLARTNLCAGCIRNMARREGLEAALHFLDHERRFRQMHCRSGMYLIREEELRP